MDLEQLAKDALNLARVYPEHAAQYRRAADNRDMANACRRYIRGTELGTELDSGDRDPQAQRDYDWQTERCGRDWQTLTYLRVAVAGLLPGLHLRLIPMGGKPWHEREEKEMDWPAACQELQQIVYAAVAKKPEPEEGNPPKMDGNGTAGMELNRETQAILFIQERIKTTRRLPTKKEIAQVLDVTPRAMRHWTAFKLAYAQRKAELERSSPPPRGKTSKDGELEAWRESGK